MLQKSLIKGLRWLLSPFSLLYALVLGVRNKLFDFGFLKHTYFKIPVIAVGNLSVGGTGKTPQIEYLIRLLQEEYTIATLSRGYKRRTKGFVLANKNTAVEEIGDEPFQFFHKFKQIQVAVDADRTNGIKQILETNPKTDLVLLDDAYQHRKVKAKFYVLLTSYDNRYTKDFVLPLGDLRETRSGAKRAHAIIITKCPVDLSNLEKTKILDEINPLSHQKVFFSTIAYDDKIHSVNASIAIKDLEEYDVVLVTGIAKPQPLLDYLQHKKINFTHLKFPDHHNFEASEIANIKDSLNSIQNQNKLILTTEKDFTRLSQSIENLYSLGIRSNITESDSFNTFVKQSIESNKD